MPNISSLELIAQFQTALRDGWGYIYGASGEIWTQAQQNAASREQTKKYGQKWVGHRVADCSGLFAWAFRQLGGYCYHGSNTMFRRYSSASGSLSAGNEPRASRSNLALPSTNSTLRKGITTSDCTSARARSYSRESHRSCKTYGNRNFQTAATDTDRNGVVSRRFRK